MRDTSTQNPQSNVAELKDHYTALNICETASQDQIKAAFYQLKNTYNCDNPALYSLLGSDEAGRAFDDIVESYRILSDPKKRREYDQLLRHKKERHKTIERSAFAPEESLTQQLKRQHKPKAPEKNPERLVNRLDQDFIQGCRLSGTQSQDQSHPLSWSKTSQTSFTADNTGSNSNEAENQSGYPPPDHQDSQNKNPNILKTNDKNKKVSSTSAPAKDNQETHHMTKAEKLERALANESQLEDGNLLKALREATGQSYQEIQEMTKISLSHLRSLEENRFDLLPQPVYVRGFLQCYLQSLGIKETRKIIRHYIERLETWQKEKHP